MIAEAFGKLFSGGWVNKPAGDDYWYKSRAPAVAGMRVDEESALSFATVFACVNKLSKTVATLPVHAYEKTGIDKREQVDDEIAELLTGKASDDTLGLTLREALLANTMLWGNGYLEIEYSNGGGVQSLHLLESKRTEVKIGADGRRYYEYRPDGAVEPKQIPPRKVLHVPGLSFNGQDGLSVIGYNRLAIALGMAATQFGASFFGNGAWAGGFVKRSRDADKTNPLSKEGAESFLASLNERFRGPDKAFGFGLLREDMEFQQLQMPFEDAMFLGTRRFTREDICAIFDVPPSKIHDLSRATFSNVENFDISWVKDSVLPWCVRLEAAISAKFYDGTRRYLKHNVAGLMRGDFKTRMDGYAIGLLNGVWSINDVRRMEDLNPIEGGDDHYRPLNVGRVGDSFEVTPGNGPGGSGTAGEWLVGLLASNAKPEQPPLLTQEVAVSAIDPEAFRPLIEDAAKRVVTKESKALGTSFKRRAKEDTTKFFEAWLETFYQDQEAYAADALTPILAGYERAGGRVIRGPMELAASYAKSGRDAVLAFLETPEGIPGLVSEWSEHKADDLAAEWMAALTNGDQI